MTHPILSVHNISKAFGGLQAVNNVSFDIAGEHVVGIIGPNGSGKSTLINLITGITPADGGSVLLNGREVCGMRPHKIFALGLNRTFQNTRIFPNLTVRQNVQISAWNQGLPDSRVFEEIDRLNLQQFAELKAESLSYGHRKLLELGMSLVGRPRIVLLDEPLAGVHDAVVQRISEIVRATRETTFVIVEHNVSFIMKNCERIIVLNQGQLQADGTPKAVRENPQVIEAYLGSGEY